jgi:hypothetical protein
MNKPVPLVFYHGNCPDGTTSAWVAHKYFKGQAEFKPLVYGQPFRAPAGLPRPVYMLDYCLKTNKDMKRLEQFAKPFKFTVIDHHDSKDVRAALKGLKSVTFVPGQSGARLTWKHLFPDEAPPAIVAYTEDRDLWNWKLPQSHEINAWLSSYPLNDPVSWDAPAGQLNHGGGEARAVIVAQGSAILRYQEACFSRAEELARLYDIPLPGGKTVRVKGANVSERSFSSEVAGRLAKDAPLGFTWYVGADGLYSFSLRSREKDGIHLGELASHLSKTILGGRSGGGHAQAAGMEFERLPLFLIRGYNTA